MRIAGGLVKQQAVSPLQKLPTLFLSPSWQVRDCSGKHPLVHRAQFGSLCMPGVCRGYKLCGDLNKAHTFPWLPVLTCVGK